MYYETKKIDITQNSHPDNLYTVRFVLEFIVTGKSAK